MTWIFGHRCPLESPRKPQWQTDRSGIQLHGDMASPTSTGKAAITGAVTGAFFGDRNYHLNQYACGIQSQGESFDLSEFY
jgi:hypothetical protein